MWSNLPFVEKTAVNQRFLRFQQKNRYVFQFPQSGYGGIDLPQGIGFGEWMIYNSAKGYFLEKEKEVAQVSRCDRNIFDKR